MIDNGDPEGRFLLSVPHTNDGPSHHLIFILAHMSHWLKLSFCNSCLCVVRNQQFLLQRTSHSKLLAGF